MKKLMIIAAIALTAVSAQASKFNWMFVDECESATGDLTGYTAYLIGASDWTSGDLSSASGVGAVLAKAIATAPYTDWSADCDPSSDYYYYEYASDPITGSKAATGDDLDYYVVFDNGSKYYAAATTGDIWADDDNNKGQVPFGSVLGLALDTSTFTSYSAAPGPGPEPGGVPEPTSGLLLLVGLAGMALKRKIA